MITPSINEERQENSPPMSEETSLEEVLSMITRDVAELRSLYLEQARDAAESVAVGRQPEYRLRILIRAWERTQDTHWSWYKEIQNASSATAQGFESLGQSVVGTGN